MGEGGELTWFWEFGAENEGMGSYEVHSLCLSFGREWHDWVFQLLPRQCKDLIICQKFLGNIIYAYLYPGAGELNGLDWRDWYYSENPCKGYKIITQCAQLGNIHVEF